MKILCLSDIHGKIQNIKDLLVKAEKSMDAVIVCGDWTTFGASKDVICMIKILREYNCPLLCVAGNCDSKEIQKALEEEKVSIDGKGKIFGNIGFFGLSASNITSLLTPFERTEQKLKNFIDTGYEAIGSASTKVLVSHTPPFNTKIDKLKNGQSCGSRAVREFIDSHEVDLVICGHIHEARGVDKSGNTLVANIGSFAQGYYSIIEIDKCSNVELLSL